MNKKILIIAGAGLVASIGIGYALLGGKKNEDVRFIKIRNTSPIYIVKNGIPKHVPNREVMDELMLKYFGSKKWVFDEIERAEYERLYPNTPALRGLNLA